MMAESMNGLKRTHRCAELSLANVGETVTVMGWVQKNRNKGGLDFVDLRDRSGIVQLIFEEGKSDPAVLEKAKALQEAQSNMKAEAEVDQKLLARAQQNARKLIENYIVCVGEQMGTSYHIHWIED